jgi:hypothetical protein
MSVYRYYLPNVKPADVTDDTLAALGLSDRLRDCPLKRQGSRIEVVPIHNNGPNGSNGALIVPQPADRKGARTYHPDEFAWHKSERDNYWIVWDKLNPPTPEGLQRWEMVSGVVCELGDGQLWQCPIVRTRLSQCHVPCHLSRPNGVLKVDVLAQYEDIWQLTFGLSVRLLESNWGLQCVEIFGAEVAHDCACKLLAVNYRVSTEEAWLLGLFTTINVDDVIDAAINKHYFEDVATNQKKTEYLETARQRLLNAWRGAAESIQNTHQPGPTSNS